MELLTTDEKLAQRIGKEIRKACGGAVGGHDAVARPLDPRLMNVAFSWHRSVS
jgi:hypothetical protein